MVKKEIVALREEMKKQGIDVYYVPTSDFHGSEYVGDYFQVRKFLSGFTGSAGTLIVTMHEAGLWTDGRYFLQAELQLKDTGITLYRMGEEGVPSKEQFLMEKMPEGGCLGFDGRVVEDRLAVRYEWIAQKKQGTLKTRQDLMDAVWTDRPALSAEKVSELDICYAGESRGDKIARIRQKMQEYGAGYHIISSLDDIAWTLNIRGNDVECNPVVLSYMLFTPNEILLFANESVFSDEIKAHLKEDGVSLHPYDEIYSYVEQITPGNIVLLDKGIVNYRMVKSLVKGIYTIDTRNPAVLMKAIKNPVEVQNERKAHLKDGVAITKLLYYLKTKIGTERMTELSVTEQLEKFREKMEHYKGPSFTTIAGYAKHGAIVHYAATEETDATLEADNFLLLDMGAQFLEGTTDATRTVFLGKQATEEEKENYTTVLRGNLNLLMVKFRYGCTGVSLDYAARKPLWDRGLDFNHGTGHGVGYYLNVHESPNAFRYRITPRVGADPVLEEGMITSDEPGLYLTGKYGIRLENLILCKKGIKNEFGQFMEFEPLTFIPFDRQAIDASLMSEKELYCLNAYHKQVYEKISPYLEKEEQEWLQKECAPLS